MQQLYEAIIGEKNTIYYQTKFEKFEKKEPDLKASWNWSAFFFGGVWALYRKMYGWFFLFLGITVVSNTLEKEAPFFSAMISLILWIAFAIFSNSLYHNSLTKKIAIAKKTIDDENKLIEYLKYKGGVNTWVIWVFASITIIGILAAILIPMLAGK